MSKFKIEKNKNYTVMSNYHLRDKKLSYKAKGLLSFMLSLPDDWDYSLNGLVAVSKEGIKSIRTTLKELQEHRYLIINKKQNFIGQFEYEYCIYECPYSQEGDVVLGDVNNDQQINTDEINIDEIIDKDDKTISSFFCSKNYNVLTFELIKCGYIENNDIQLYYYDAFFNNLLYEREISFEKIIRIIHYIIPRVVSGNYKDEEGIMIQNKFGYLKSSIINNLNKLDNFCDELW